MRLLKIIYTPLNQKANTNEKWRGRYPPYNPVYSPTRGLNPLLVEVLKDVRDALCITPKIACQPSLGGFDISI
jgi:hypothetical protein